MNNQHLKSVRFTIRNSDVAEASRIVSVGNEVIVNMQDDQTGEQDVSLDVIAYSGEARNYFGLPTYFDFDDMEMRRPEIPLLWLHNQDEPLGDAKLKINKRKRELAGSADVTRLTDKSEWVRRECRNAQEKKKPCPFECSFTGDGQLNYIAHGEESKVNGKVIEGPAYIMRNTKVTELSLCMIGQMEKNSVTIRNSDGSDVTPPQTPAVVQPTPAVVPNTAQPGAAPAAAPGAAPAAAPVAQPGSAVIDNAADPIAEMRRRSANEINRQTALQSIANQYDLTTCEIVVDGTGENEVRANLAAHAIANNWTPEQTELVALRNGRPAATQSHGGAAAHIRNGQSFDQHVASAALAISIFNVKPETALAGLSDEQKALVESPEYASYTVHQLMDEMIENSGGHFRGNRRSDAFIREGVAAEARIQVQNQFSTIRLPTVVQRSIELMIKDDYESADATWSQWCEGTSTTHFNSMERITIDLDGSIKRVTHTGELSHMNIDEGESYQIKAETYGAMIGADRQTLISDNFDTVRKKVRAMVRRCAMAVEKEAWRVLLANLTATGVLEVTGALSVDQLDIDKVLEQHGNQIVNGGEPIAASLNTVLCGLENSSLAGQMYGQKLLETVSGSGVTASYGNRYQNRFRPIVSPYVSNGLLRDVDGKPFANQVRNQAIFMSDPRTRAAVEVTFLNNRRRPWVESDNAAFNVLGMQWRTFFDFGVAFADKRAIVVLKP